MEETLKKEFTFGGIVTLGCLYESVNWIASLDISSWKCAGNNNIWIEPWVVLFSVGKQYAKIRTEKKERKVNLDPSHSLNHWLSRSFRSQTNRKLFFQINGAISFLMKADSSISVLWWNENIINKYLLLTLKKRFKPKNRTLSFLSLNMKLPSVTVP